MTQALPRDPESYHVESGTKMFFYYEELSLVSPHITLCMMDYGITDDERDANLSIIDNMEIGSIHWDTTIGLIVRVI